MTTRSSLHHERFVGAHDGSGAPVFAAERTRDGATDVRLLERQEALDDLRGMLQSVGRPHFGLALIEGEQGIGKTALVNTACRMGTSTGSRVLRARGSEQEHDRPLGIVHQIVAQLHAASVLDDAFRQRIRRVRIEGTDERERFELFQELDEVLVNIASASNVLLAIDDVHFADHSSLDWLHFMSCRIDSRPLAMILTSLPPQHVLTQQPLDPLLVDSSPRRIELRPLSPSAVTQLVRIRFGTPAVRAGLGVACHEATRGNPALLFTLFDDLARSDGAPDPDRLTSHVQTASPRRLVRSIVHRTSKAGPESLAVAQSIALLDGLADVRDIAEVAQIGVTTVATTVEHLASAGILEAAEPLRFVHPLVRSALLGAIPFAEARRLHLRCACVLQRRGEPNPIVAAHFVETDPTGSEDVAAILLAGCRHALLEDEPERAARFLARAESEVPLFRQHPSLLFEMAESHARLGHANALELLRVAEDTTTDPERLLPIVFAMAEASGTRQLAEALQLLRSVHLRDVVDEGAGGRIAVALCLLSEPTTVGAHPPLRPARVDDRPLVRALRATYSVADPHGSTAVGLARILEQAIDPAHLASDDPLPSQVGRRAIVALMRIGRSDVAVRLVEDAQERRSNDRGDTAAGLLRLQGMLAMRHGQLETAQNCLDLAHHRNPNSSWSFGALDASWTAILEALQGRPDTALEQLESFTPSLLDVDPYLIPESLGWLHLLAGRFDDAAACFTETGRLAEACGVRNPAATSWQSGAARALAATGDLRSAHAVASEAVELTRAFGAPGPLALALGALGSTRPRDRIGVFNEAVRAADRSLDVLLKITTRLELGRALHKESFDDQAIDVLRVAGDLAHHLGAPSVIGATVAQLRACGSRPVRLALNGIESLTPAQLRVVRLAASGTTNTEIAQTLYISVKTVESHLARAYRKLGVRSRGELTELFET